MRRKIPALALAFGGFLLVGCGASGSAAQDVAARFYAAVEAGHGSAACNLLAPESRRQIEQAEQLTCAVAVLSEDLPAPGSAVAAERFGNQAQVRFEHDTAFVAEFADGWRVVAAGCAQRQSRPYDCVIAGG